MCIRDRAEIVADLELDVDSVIAAMLHDCIEDTPATHEEIAKKFGPTVAALVEGVTKLTRVQYVSKEEEQMENLRKMLMAMAQDIRVILIKICDRLHNMRTMEYQSPRKQREKSLETMEIYAPIAHRLGMQKLKWELEDLSLRYLDPIGYKEIEDEPVSYTHLDVYKRQPSLLPRAPSSLGGGVCSLLEERAGERRLPLLVG